MPVRKTKVLDFYAAKHWAILPETLQEMYQLYTQAIERKESGISLDVEAVAAKLGRPLDNSQTVTIRDGIAIIPIDGPIFRYANLFTEISGARSIETLATDFQEARTNPNVKAIVLEINSPGGEADGTSELAQHIASARGEKPIVAYVSNLGASAAYWIASAADEIVANKAASLGSIGVVCSVCVHKDKNHLEFVSSQSPNKRPNVESEGGRAQIQTWLDSLADVFINSVAQNRSMLVENVIEKGGKGGLKVGQQAVDAGLADRLGTLEEVIAELSDSNTQNLNSRFMLQGGNTSTKGVGTMADKQPEKKIEETDKKPAAVDPPKDEKPDAKVDDKSAELAAAQAENEELKRKLAEAETDKAAQAKENEAVKTRVANLEKEARTSRFTEMSKGWPGETKDNLAMLEHLATSSGDDSDVFKAHRKTMDAAKAQIEAGGLFKELGSNAPGEGSAEAEVAGKVAALRKAEPSLTDAQAAEKVYAANPELYKRFLQEERRSVN